MYVLNSPLFGKFLVLAFFRISLSGIFLKKKLLVRTQGQNNYFFLYKLIQALPFDIYETDRQTDRWTEKEREKS